MFKLKPGNVFQKINTMDRKQAYTWGAIIVVVFVSLITLASFMGDADDASFDGMQTHGYDLAQMPFATDAAEQYLLENQYPDMQDNNATVLYSAEEKAARQEEDAQEEAMAEDQPEEDSVDPFQSGKNDRQSARDSDDNYPRGHRYNGAGTRTPTTVGQLNSATMTRTGGNGISSSWGAPGDFSTYKSQDKGKETPPVLKEQNARQALGQFARASVAGARLKDSKGANAKRALMGGDVRGSDAFTKDGVDLDKLQRAGLGLDTNAPTMSSDFNDLAKDVADAANKADKQNKEAEKTLEEKLLEQLYTGLLNMGLNILGNVVDKGIDAMFNKWAGNSAGREYAANLLNMNANDCFNDASCVTVARDLLNEDDYAAWASGNKTLKDFGIGSWGAGRSLRRNGDAGYMEQWHSGYNHSVENNLKVGATNCSNVTCPDGKKPTVNGNNCQC